MTVGESVMVALFCILVVFAVLFSLFIVIKIFSFLIGIIEKSNQNPAA